MMRRWGIVVVLALAGAVAISVLLRAPRYAPAPVVAVAPADTVSLAVEITNAGVTTTPGSIAVGRTVALAIANRSAAGVRASLSGYEDRVTTGSLAPGATWRTTFLADRPGEQLAWVVNGAPQGRLDVLGSHLVEGHR